MLPLYTGVCDCSGRSLISIGSNRVVRSPYRSNDVGADSPRMPSTLTPCAEPAIGDRCGLRGMINADAGRVVLGHRVLFRANVTTMDTDVHEPASYTLGQARHEPRVTRDHTRLGPHVIVPKGVTTWCCSVEAADNIAVDSVPPRMIVAGRPAAIVRELDSLAPSAPPR